MTAVWGVILIDLGGYAACGLLRKNFHRLSCLGIYVETMTAVWGVVLIDLGYYAACGLLRKNFHRLSCLGIYGEAMTTVWGVVLIDLSGSGRHRIELFFHDIPGPVSSC